MDSQPYRTGTDRTVVALRINMILLLVPTIFVKIPSISHDNPFLIRPKYFEYPFYRYIGTNITNILNISRIIVILCTFDI